MELIQPNDPMYFTETSAESYDQNSYKIEFNDGKSRFEDAVRKHHDHLIDIDSGEVIEFVDDEIEKIQNKIAERLGFDLVGHKLELYGKRNEK